MTAQASHNDIYREIGALHQQNEDIEVRVDAQNVEIAAIKASVLANGSMTSEALMIQREMRADIAAIKAKVLAYDLLKARVIGAAMAAAVAWAAFWTLTGGKITAFFNGSAPP